MTQWIKGFKNLSKEHSFRQLKVEGTVPKEIQGTFFRNGAGIFESYGVRFPHWFDGDGTVASVKFRGSAVEGAVKLVQTKERQEEAKSNRNLYDGYNAKFSTVWQRLGILIGKDRTKNTANTSVMFWQNKLFALMEAKPPIQISTEDLKTIGEDRLNGLITHSFSAHPHRIPKRKAIYNFCVEYGPRCKLQIFELPEEGSPRLLTKVPLSWSGMVHDFIPTDNHLVFFISPLKLNLTKFIFGKEGYADCLEWKPELGTEVVVVPLANPDQPILFKTEPFFQFHFANAYEHGNQIIVDFARFPDFGINQWLGEILLGPASDLFDSSYVRAVIDIKDKKIKFETIFQNACEFPTIASKDLCQDFQDVYLCGFSDNAARKGPVNRFGKLNVKTGNVSFVPLPDGHFPGEPLCINGNIISLIYDSTKDLSYLGIAKASNPEGGIICKAWFDHAIPPGFHGIFIP